MVYVLPRDEDEGEAGHPTMDSDGWRASFDSSLANGSAVQREEGRDDDEVHIWSVDSSTTSNGKPSDGWHVAESKRSKRTRGAKAAAIDHSTISERQSPVVSPGPRLDDSLVDLGPSSGRRSSSGSGSTTGGGHESSVATSAATSTSSRSRATQTTQPSSVGGSRLLEESMFSELAIDDAGDGLDAEQAPKRNKYKSKKKRDRKRAAKCREVDTHKIANDSHNNLNHASSSSASLFALETTYDSSLPAHRDERQVDLDVRRSFVSLPDTPYRRARRRQLQDLIVGVLRRSQGLSYYQGYHDVVSILLEVLVPSVVEQAETHENPWASEQDFRTTLLATRRLTLLYLRDFMAPSLEPCLGWLKTLRNIVRRADVIFAHDVVERAGGLPYFALSWLITLLSHDVPGAPECEAGKRVVDTLLLDGPEAMLWMLAALVLEAKLKQDGEEEEVDDPDMLHHSLSKLPLRLEDEEVLQRVLTRARELKKEHGDPSPWQGIMGPKSVLSTSPLLKEEDTSPKDWSTCEAQAEECLPSPPSTDDKAAIKKAAAAAMDDVVLDPYPTPPGSEADFYEGNDMTDSKKGKRPPRHLTSRGLPSTSTALFLFGGAAVVVVASAAAVILSSSGPGGAGGGNSLERAAKMRVLLNDAAHLGKGLAKLVAMTAAGAAGRGGA
ncbi:hypothetical protein BDZ90DRAFT_167872 [Jaminaea rosea]|uniref:Rab-GAP TBC domain-containing protein n=1 Tax=Jaminaea rosea TaxID=1569628 RepID=A0A316UQN5_9BASI|nr:hypothetical protein BDZ90DRAFT_167872 [Jaminaea rosea]PWN27617.1 hypothetical protein BDZ90DRAFT_167872 [Jaminaea rosea]